MNTITVKRSHFGGMVYAECECGYTCHYWEEPEDLEHDCTLRAACGHVETFGAITGQPCGKCVRKAHKRATGKR